VSEPGHIPVLPDEVAQLLAPTSGGTLLDCTLGRGGHAALLLPRLAPGGTYIGFDLDEDNLAFARQRLAPIAEQHGITLTLHHTNFADARATLGDASVDRLLADLGFASAQMDDAARGFSFTADGPLDMRLNRDQPTSAADLVNRLGERELADLIYQLGEERLSRRIARKITEARRKSPITTTSGLAELVSAAYGPAARRSHIHPATRTFMALRIAVNGELEALDRLLDDLPALVRPGGRAAIISFHSLEDRRVKHAMQRLEQDNLGRRLTRKPITASDAEVAANPRSRSAKLRAFERA